MTSDQHSNVKVAFDNSMYKATFNACVDTRGAFPHRKTYSFKGLFIDNYHRFLATAPRLDEMLQIGVEGWPLLATALRLYELSY